MNHILETSDYDPEKIFKVIGEHFLHENNKDLSDLFES